jgi:5-methyltetrahydrofolate--homocysteine methyltransferase
MGTEVMALGLAASDFGGERYAGCNEALVLSRPDIVRRIHDAYLDAGADVVETDSFTASRLKLSEYGLADKTLEINRAAARIAREACDIYATRERPRFVAGSMGPTGMLVSSSDPVLSKIAFDELAEIYGEQARALAEGGVDLLLLETMQDLLELKAAIAGITREFARGMRRLPIQAQPTLITEGRMLLGTDIRAIRAVLDALPIDVIGLNCSTGPAQMRDSIRYLCETSRCFVSVIPNAGLPIMGSRGETIYPQTPAELARELGEFVREYGVDAVGGCCGTTPEHIRQMRAMLDGPARSGSSRRSSRAERSVENAVPEHVASAMTAVSLEQEPRPLLVGERINSQGSRRMKRLLLAERYDEIAMLGREQVEEGAHVLDVCCALTERSDEEVQMREIVRRLSQSVEAPLVIDSTEPGVMEVALKNYPGRAVLNSVHLEAGRAKIDRVLPMALEHGAVVIALTIDEQGMAKSVERKVEVARRIYEIVVGEYGLHPGALIFDPLTFTLATGDAEFLESGTATIEGIRAIKSALPGVLTSLGISNVSFGLQPLARAALNSVFLHHCVQAGLDCALVHAKEIAPYAEIDAPVRELCDDLIFNRRSDALQRLIEHFDLVTPSERDARASSDAEEQTSTLPIGEQIHNAILHRRKEGIERKIDEALRARTPVAVLNEILLPAMKEVGDRFGAGELILPFVLQSAEVMKKAVAHLEQFLEKQEGVTKGKVVLATVFGDVHDIGKNLVNTILTNNGYTVFDLGKQVPMNAILEKAIEVHADAIGLSALLVSTSKQMPVCVQEQDARGLRFPVIVGGAAINRDFGRRIALVDGERFFEPGLYYAKDAFEGLEIMDRLTGDAGARRDFVERIRYEALAQRTRAAESSDGARARVVSAVRSQMASIPVAPFLGARTLERVDVRALWPCFDLRSLFRLSWGAANTKGAEFDRLLREEFEPRLRRYEAEAERGAILQPRAVYGYFRAAAEGDDVVLFDADDAGTERARLHFTRQPGGEHLCLADYVRERDGLPDDVVALQVVTIGDEATRRIERLQASGDYSEAYFLHGFSVQAAEALAEHVHRQIRAELGIEQNRGKRYSWGYGACPDLAQHEIVFSLLDVTRRIGVSLTAAYQMVPEQSTAAIVMHHPKASYFNASATRELTPS